MIHKLIFFLIFIILSNNIYSNELYEKCRIILDDLHDMTAESKLKLGLEYRNKYFSDDKYFYSYCLIEDSFKSGNVDAEFVLAQFYGTGEFVELDYNKMMKMTYDSIDKGSSCALNNLASYYFNGIFLERDLSKAIHYYEQSIDKGCSFAKVGLGYAYFLGQGVPQDINKAIELTLEATQDPNKLMGNEMAMVNLGFYYNFIGLKEKGIYWTEKAASLYDPAAQVNLGNIYATDPDFANLEKSLYWLNKSIERGNPQAYFMLGSLYSNGSKVYPVDEEKAWNNYYKAAELGNGDAQYNLGNWLFTGRFVKKDEKEALNWYLKAANNGNLYAMYTLSELYKEGTKDILQDPEKAKYWLEKAKENGLNL